MAAASVSSTRRARLRSATERRLDALRDRVDRGQSVEEWFEAIEPQGILRVAPGARRVLVHFEEHAVDTGGDARRRQRLDVLGEAGCHAVAGARQLQAVRHVEYD